MVVCISALMKDVSDRALEFIFSIPSLDWRSFEVTCLTMFFVIMILSHMVPTWSSIYLTLQSLPILFWRFMMFPVKVFWSSRSTLFSSWSQWCHLRIQSIVSSPPLSDISSGAVPLKDTVCLVILDSPLFSVLIPLCIIIDVWWACDSRTWKISPISPGCMMTLKDPQKL